MISEKPSVYAMPKEARVWVYQASRKLKQSEVELIRKAGREFIAQWSAHGAQLRASFDVLHDLFVVLAVDERQALASGCSIDKSVHFMQKTGRETGIEFFDRMRVAYIDGDEVKQCSLRDFEELARAGKVTADTVVFNNMVTTRAEFESNWQIPLHLGWQSRVLS